MLIEQSSDQMHSLMSVQFDCIYCSVTYSYKHTYI